MMTVGKMARLAKRRLLEEMAVTDQKSPEYSKLNKELETFTKGESNQNSWKVQLITSVITTFCSVAGSTAQVLHVLKHEDRGNVLTTKATNFRMPMKP